jgi:hypothetical protein
MKISRWAAAGVFGAAAVLAVAAPAAAHHNEVPATVDVDGCELAAQTTWALDEHQVATTVLVVRVDGQVTTAAVGEPLVLPLPPGTTAVDWRVWGGGERDYDSPPLDGLDALLVYLEAGGGELDADAPGVAWHTVAVAGCPAPTPTPTPTAGPSPSPGVSPAATPGATSPPAAAGGGLPVTGAPVLALAGAGVGLLGLGGGAVWLARRRTAAGGSVHPNG